MQPIAAWPPSPQTLRLMVLWHTAQYEQDFYPINEERAVRTFQARFGRAVEGQQLLEFRLTIQLISEVRS